MLGRGKRAVEEHSLPRRGVRVSRMEATAVVEGHMPAPSSGSTGGPTLEQRRGARGELPVLLLLRLASSSSSPESKSRSNVSYVKKSACGSAVCVAGRKSVSSFWTVLSSFMCVVPMQHSRREVRVARAAVGSDTALCPMQGALSRTSARAAPRACQNTSAPGPPLALRDVPRRLRQGRGRTATRPRNRRHTLATGAEQAPAVLAFYDAFCKYESSNISW